MAAHNAASAAMAEAYRADPNLQAFLLHSGDWAGLGGKEEDWDNQYFARTNASALEMQAHVPVQGCMGNHEQYNVALVINGHNHNYARCEVNGIQHITTGGGGASLHEPDMTASHLVAAEKAHHFCKAGIVGGTLEFEACRTDGCPFDRFTLRLP